MKRHSRVPILIAVVAAPLVWLVVRSAGSGLSPGEAVVLLERGFPDQAAQVLGRGGPGFASAADGFAPERDPVAAARAPMGLKLPLDASAPIRLSAPGGFAAEVRELEARGEGARVEGAVGYPRAGGASFWTGSDSGCEEWILGRSRRGEPLARWRVSGARLRAGADEVTVLDAGGTARL